MMKEKEMKGMMKQMPKNMAAKTIVAGKRTKKKKKQMRTIAQGGHG